MSGEVALPQPPGRVGIAGLQLDEPRVTHVSGGWSFMWASPEVCRESDRSCAEYTSGSRIVTSEIPRSKKMSRTCGANRQTASECSRRPHTYREQQH